MKITRSVVVSLAMILLSAPVIHGQDLSKYRNFSFGMSLADISKQIDKKPTAVAVVHPLPALIQELTWWRPQSFGSSPGAEPIQEILFSFYNGELYKIGVTYDNSTTDGLTADDMVQAMSAEYGTATRPTVEINFPTTETYGTREKVIVRWEDPQYSFNLFRSSLSNTFGLVMFTKQLNAQAEAVIAQTVKLEQQEAPQKELARVKKEADDLETSRQKNMKTFHP
jgi:hypothetical protein